MRAHLHLLPLSILLAVPACGDSSSNNNPSSDLAGSRDLGAGSDMADDHYLPAGYTLSPFLSQDAERSFAEAEMVLDNGKDYRAVIETEVGRMVMDLYEVDTPITVNSFVFLARHHYFDGIVFHRVIAGFVAQGGDPSTAEPGLPGGPGYTFGLEVKKGYKYDAAGVVGMARTTDPNSNGSQFFITLAAQPSLDDQYTIFGKLTEGLDVLPKIHKGTQSAPPPDPTVMTRVYIVEK